MTTMEPRRSRLESSDLRARQAAALDWGAAELRSPLSSLSIPEVLRRVATSGAADEQPATPFDQFAPNFASLREVILGGCLRRGEVATLISAAKVGKTWLLLSLLLSAAAGRDWLGHAIGGPHNVLAIDNELHRETFVHRVRTIAAALGLAEEEFAPRLYVETIRGRQLDAEQIRALVRRKYAGVALGIIGIDSLYKTIPRGGDENSNAGMKEVFEVFTALADEASAAVVAVHHATKGNQAEKEVTDVGAGAGSIARAADSHLILRPHAEPDHAVLEARVRSFAPLAPQVLRWSYPLWTVATGLDPAHLRNSSPQRSAERPEKTPHAQDAASRLELVEIVRQITEGGAKATINAIRSGSKRRAGASEWRNEKVKRIVDSALRVNLLTEVATSSPRHYVLAVDTPLVDAPHLDASLLDAPLVDASLLDASPVDVSLVDAPPIEVL